MIPKKFVSACIGLAFALTLAVAPLGCSGDAPPPATSAADLEVAKKEQEDIMSRERGPGGNPGKKATSKP